MYAAHFGLRSEAFSLTPDPSFLYMSPDHAEGLAALKIGLEGRRGLIVMIGEVGTGKTTLLYSLLSELGTGIHTAFVSNTTLSFDGMLRQALADFGVPCESKHRVDQLTALNGFLRQCAAEGTTAALVIDEAQNLSNDAFENLRLLSNYETYTTKLLQIVLVGQPELENKLAQTSLRQVAERVAVRCHINPLGNEESVRYVEHRLHCAGGSSKLFTPAAIRLVVRAAAGIPRRINIICHNAMLFAYGRGETIVGAEDVRAAIREKEGRGLVRIGPFGSRLHGPHTSRWWAIAASALAGVGTAFVVGWNLGSLGTPAPTEEAVVRTRSIAPIAPAPRERAPEPPKTEAAAPSPSPEPERAGAPVDDRPTADDRGELAPTDEPAVDPHALAEPRATDAAAVTDPVATLAAAVATGQAPEAFPEPAGDRSRQVQVPPGKTLTALALEFYGSANHALLDQIRAANPQITNMNLILAGDTLRLPDVDASMVRVGNGTER